MDRKPGGLQSMGCIESDNTEATCCICITLCKFLLFMGKPAKVFTVQIYVTSNRGKS